MVLAAAPTPADAAKLTRSQLRALLKRTHRPRRGIEAAAERLRDIFRADYLHQLPQVEKAMGRQALALIQQLDAACSSVDQFAAAIEDARAIKAYSGAAPVTRASGHSRVYVGLRGPAV
jgi:hypothetical protein